MSFGKEVSPSPDGFETVSGAKPHEERRRLGGRRHKDRRYMPGLDGLRALAGECKLFCVNGIFAQTIFGLEYSWLLPIWEGRALLESNLSAQLVSAGGNGNCLFEVSLSNSISSRAEPRR